MSNGNIGRPIWPLNPRPIPAGRTSRSWGRMIRLPDGRVQDVPWRWRDRSRAGRSLVEQDPESWGSHAACSRAGGVDRLLG
jgi:hypothetical protein